jgi:cadmium resistance protein CadD (predicted permease)
MMLLPGLGLMPEMVLLPELGLLPELVKASATAASAFCASNLDDILLLMLLFSGADGKHARWHVVAGQYLGFALLILPSLLGFVGGQLLPQQWIGVLGLLPVALGVSQIIDSLGAPAQCCGEAPGSPGDSLAEITPEWVSQLGLPCTPIIAVAGLTLANGGDNIGLYMPLFTRSNTIQLTTTLIVFFLLVGVWCLAAWRLVHTTGIAGLISRYGQQLMPLVLIGLGLLILIESDTFSFRPLAVMVLSALLAMAISLLHQLQRLAELPIPPEVG